MNDEIMQHLDLLPADVGSRRVNSDQLRAMFEELRKLIPKFSGFTVWRFGHPDHNLLEYPVDKVPDAIDHYDVMRIYGRGFLDGQIEPFVEIDLWAGGGGRDWNWLFRLYGPKAEVDSVASLLREHVGRWQRTWHKWFHHIWWYWGAFWILFILLMLRVVTALPVRGGVTPSSVLQIIVLAYLAGFMILVVAGAGALAPFMWFYRPGSPIETRRMWLPRLSIFAALAIIAGLAANWIWSVIMK